MRVFKILIVLFILIVPLCPITFTAVYGQATTLTVDILFLKFKLNDKGKNKNKPKLETILRIPTLICGADVLIYYNNAFNESLLPFNTYTIISKQILLNSAIAIIAANARSLKFISHPKASDGTALILSVSFSAYRLIIFCLSVAYYKIKRLIKGALKGARK